jgi:metallo-beta-lactamase family protein
MFISVMKISFFGAAGMVTGSCSLVESGRFRILIDCGMFQGSDVLEMKNASPLTFDPSTLTAVIVTHAHLDHVGRLPLLVKNGFKGDIFCTPPTRDLARLILEDAQSVMEYNHQNYGHPLLYTLDDVESVMTHFKVVKYLTPTTIEEPSAVVVNRVKKLLKIPNKLLAISNVPIVTFTLHDAGHIFGSAFIELNIENKKLVFSGDIGNINVPILRDTETLPKNIDLLVCESTYGDRSHVSSAEREKLIEGIIQDAMRKDGVLLIPSFALERTQELLYELTDLVERHKTLPHVPIFLDSPLAIDALRVFEKYPEYYDVEATKFYKDGADLFEFPGLTLTHSRTESMTINHSPTPKVIIAGAGMMNGGRILHHAIRYLSDPKNTLLIVGYQSPGTLGWRLAQGESPVKIHDENVRVHCQIKVISALSAHADKEKLFSWISNGNNSPNQIVLNHGDEPASEALVVRLREKGMNAFAAKAGMVVEL